MTSGLQYNHHDKHITTRK